MNPKRIVRRLYWKELRQTLPLVVVLLVISVLVHIVFTFNEEDSARKIILVALPYLFAIGAGALMIGQERETKTIQWLQTLPIEPRDVVRVKLVTCLIGLIAVWIASGLLYFIFVRIDGGDSSRFWVRSSLSTYENGLIVLPSVFCLLVGIYLSWLFQSSLLALFLLVPIVVIPINLMLYVEYDWGIELGVGLWCGASLLGSAIALVLGWKKGIDCLGAQKGKSVNRLATLEGTAKVTAAANEVITAEKKLRWRVPHRPITALLWQFLHHNRIVLAATTLMILLGIVWNNSGGGGGIAGTTLAAIVGISWLAASVFSGDSLHGSIRFLATRGVSANWTWITRQAIPISILAAAILLFVVVSEYYASGMRLAVPSVRVFYLYALGLVWVVYACCQWVGQMINSPIVAAIVAPATAGLAIGAAGMAVTTIGTPIWVLIALSFVPLLTTFLLTRKWMDRRTGFGCWAAHAACLSICGATPFLCLIPPFLTARMPDAVKNGLASPNNSSGTIRNVRWALPHDESTLHNLGGMKGIQFLMAKSALIEFQETDSTNSAEYLRCVAAVVQNCRQLRLEPSLANQDIADAGEIWLLQEMQKPGAVTKMGANWHDVTVDYLADSVTRNRLRRSAIRRCWNKWNSESVDYQLGGYYLADRIPFGTWRDQLASERRIERAIGHLWALSADGEKPTQQLRDQLAAELGYPISAYNDDRDASQVLHSAAWNTNGNTVPGRWWGGAWESEAKQLKRAGATQVNEAPKE